MKTPEQGFTLIEVVIAAALSTVVIFGVFTILLVSNKQLDVINAKMSLQEGPREALFKMAQEIRQTGWHQINALSAPDASNIESSSTITFNVPANDANALVAGDYSPQWAFSISYSLNATTHQILRTATNTATGQSRQAILANEVSALTFSRNDNAMGLITIAITAQRLLQIGSQVRTIQTSITTQAEARNP